MDILDKIGKQDYISVVPITDIQLDQIRRLQNKGDVIRLLLGEYNTDAIKELYEYQDNPNVLADVVICVKKCEI